MHRLISVYLQEVYPHQLVKDYHQGNIMRYCVLQVACHCAHSKWVLSIVLLWLLDLIRNVLATCSFSALL